MVADAIQAMTGTDIAAPLRGYSSRAEATQSISSLTGRTSVQAAAEVLTRAYFMTEIPVAYAKRGDMALIPRARDFSMGIVNLSGSRLTIAVRQGTAEIPIERACRAWRV